MKPWKKGKVIIKLVTGDLIAVDYLMAKKFKNDYHLGLVAASVEANGIINNMIRSVREG